MSSAYVELLKDPRWQKMRLHILERDEWKCQRCSRADMTLHVHHKRYQWGKKPWEYDEASLLTLCEKCHEIGTRLQRELKQAVAAISDSDPSAWGDIATAIGFLRGIVAGSAGAASMTAGEMREALGIFAAFEIPRSIGLKLSLMNPDSSWDINVADLYRLSRDHEYQAEESV